MNNWFTVKVKYTKQLENGAFKRVSEPYLLAAMTFTDAEARIYEELGSIIRGEFTVLSISRTDFQEIFVSEDSDTFFKCKISFESFGDGEKSKKVTQNFLVSGNTIEEATETIKESLSTMLVDYTLNSVVVTTIVDIFPYNEVLDKEISRTPMPENEFETEQAEKISENE